MEVMMEDKRVADICSELDGLKRQLSRCALAGGAAGLFCCAYPLFAPLSASGRLLFWTVGVVAILAAVFVSTSAERCIRIMTKVMRYYTETTKIKSV